ncbi:MAG: hypothetical protein WDN48_18510 [Pseudolabrys sp.]
MRVLSAVIVFAFAVAGVGAASAADLPADGLGTYSTRSSGVGQRIGTMLVYDYQPGVIVRAYWQAPWRNRHYFPTTGTKPEIGRDEDLSAPSSPSEPPETFYRSWTTSSAFAREVPGTDGAPPAGASISPRKSLRP